MAHTPGPWRRADGDEDIVASDGAIVVDGYYSTVDANQFDSNLALIAAAPDLLAALKELLEIPEYQVAIGGNPHAVEALLERCRSAIAKAEGR